MATKKPKKTVNQPSAGSANTAGASTPAPANKKLEEARKRFNRRYKTRSVWLKFWPEQIGYTGEGSEVDFLRNFLVRVRDCCSYRDGVSMHGACHVNEFRIVDDKQTEYKANHAHLLLFFTDRKRMGFVLDLLKECGFVMPTEPDKLDTFMMDARFPTHRDNWHEITDIIVYHSHESDSCIKRGKAVIPRDEMITNIPADVLDQYYQKYFIENSTPLPLSEPKVRFNYGRLDKIQQAKVCADALEHGKLGGDFEDFWYSLPALTRTDDKLRTMCNRDFDRGVQTFLDSPESLAHVRCAIFIQGSADGGKTYNAIQACRALTGNCYEIDGGHTGKYDRLRSYHKSMVVSDTSVGRNNVLGIADNKFVQVYRRNVGNPIWTGDFLVITYNRDLETYCRMMGIVDAETLDAVKSRFYECTLEDGELCILKPSTRGSDDVQRIRNRMFARFYDAFMQSISGYVKQSGFDVMQDLLSCCGIKKQTVSVNTVCSSCGYPNTPCLNRDAIGNCMTPGMCVYSHNQPHRWDAGQT